MGDRNESIQVLVNIALESGNADEVVNRLSDEKRRNRQISAAAVNQIAKAEPKLLISYISALIDALNRPEAQTRWECLEALTILVAYDSRTCSKAIPEAEAALFDEESGFASDMFLYFDTLGESMAAYRRGYPVLSRGSRIQ